jgi:hypothetical protein
MSNALAIAALTATLRHLLDRGLNADLPGTLVTTRPPDKARLAGTGNQVNLFLYQVLPNAAWRNLDPRQLETGEAGQPPLALNLYYLLSAYGQNEDDPDPFSHRLLGQAMCVFHDHPVLEPAELREALEGSDLHQQAERVRITLQPLALEETTKLWTTFQTPYRLSVAYEVSVVLIDGTRSQASPAAARARQQVAR